MVSVVSSAFFSSAKDLPDIGGTSSESERATPDLSTPSLPIVSSPFPVQVIPLLSQPSPETDPSLDDVVESLLPSLIDSVSPLPLPIYQGWELH